MSEAGEIEALDNDAKIDSFADQMTLRWGEEETHLRMAIYISFVSKQDTVIFRKKIKRARQMTVKAMEA